jgi:hypothetical protein
MIDLFESETATLKKFTRAFSSCCQKIQGLQTNMISATQELSYYLRLYNQQNFPLRSESKVGDTLSQFANYIDEVDDRLNYY